MTWRLLDTGKQRAEANMALDAQLFKQLKAESDPLIHFYGWIKKSATYGYFLRPETVIDLEKVKEQDIDLARRPTGGGVIFHHLDFAFSVLIPAGFKYFSPNTLANYEFINRAVKRAVQTFLDSKRDSPSLLNEEAAALGSDCRYFCMAKPTKYDVMVGNQKVAGAAQRRSKEGYLHQGSISLLPLEEKVLCPLLLSSSEVIAAMRAHTFSLLGGQVSSAEMSEARCELKHQLVVELMR